MSSPPSDTPERERGPHELFCRNCGVVIDKDAEICPSCGVRQRPPPKSSVDSAVDDLLEGGNPFVAALLSALFPGLGQLYNRELERGLVFIVATVFAALSTLVFVGFLLFPAVWLFAIYDAYTRAELRAEELRSEAHAHELPVSETVEVATETGDETNETAAEGESPHVIAVDDTKSSEEDTDDTEDAVGADETEDQSSADRTEDETDESSP